MTRLNPGYDDMLSETAIKYGTGEIEKIADLLINGTIQNIQVDSYTGFSSIISPLPTLENLISVLRIKTLCSVLNTSDPLYFKILEGCRWVPQQLKNIVYIQEKADGINNKLELFFNVQDFKLIIEEINNTKFIFNINNIDDRSYGYFYISLVDLLQVNGFVTISDKKDVFLLESGKFVPLFINLKSQLNLIKHTQDINQKEKYLFALWKKNLDDIDFCPVASLTNIGLKIIINFTKASYETKNEITNYHFNSKVFLLVNKNDLDKQNIGDTMKIIKTDNVNQIISFKNIPNNVKLIC